MHSYAVLHSISKTIPYRTHEIVQFGQQQHAGKKDPHKTSSRKKTTNCNPAHHVMYMSDLVRMLCPVNVFLWVRALMQISVLKGFSSQHALTECATFRVSVAMWQEKPKWLKYVKRRLSGRLSQRPTNAGTAWSTLFTHISGQRLGKVGLLDC